MDERSREALKQQLQEEIAKVEGSVATKGVPRSVEERSMIARYGKLLLLAQRLLATLPRIEALEQQRPRSGIGAGGPPGRRGPGQRIRRIGGRI